jgi:TolB-like protein/cytochrome c-type biogenesis protein CcmH/NrfG
MSFFSELKRRNVIRMAGLYLVGAWLLIQIAETLLPIFHTPDWVLQALVVLLAIGLLPALVFSWVYELTPEGLKRDVGVDPARSIAPQTAQRMDRLILAGLAAVILVVAADRFWPREEKAGSESTLVKVSSPSASSAGSKVDSDPGLDPTRAGPSIAVLPFLNMSPDADNAYFADGISEELLNVLARIDGLKVASRTSAFTFKGKDTPIPEIARLLGVQHVLEGSVRKQGQRVRITAQLIHAGDDGHVWSQTYDRELTDIFAVQQEIAEAIAGELGGLLGAADLKVAAPTADLVAYERFLRGRARFHQRAELVEAIADLEFAVQQDPQFADAWIYLAATNVVFSGYSDALDHANTRAAARSAVTRAQALRPNDPMVLAVRGQLESNDGRLVVALDLFEQASRLSRQDSTPLLWLGQTLAQSGYAEEGIAALERAVRMEPLVGINQGSLAFAYFCAGQFERGAERARLGANGGWSRGLVMQMIEMAASGDRTGAANLIQGDLASSLFPPGTTNAQREAFIAAVRDPAQTDAWLALHETPPEAWRVPPETLAAMDRFDPLLDWFTPERFPHRWMLRSFWLPSTRALREDARFIPIAKHYGLIELWEQRGYPPGCRRVDDARGDHLDCSGQAP